MREKISIVFPVYNEAENLDTLHDEVKKACLAAEVDYEMIFVDDGSTDASLASLKDIAVKDRSVRYVSLSRNFGHQNALFAGMSCAKGDAVITMDADLQHPPSLIPKMVKLWREGEEVVYTTKANANLPFLKNLIVKASYYFIQKVSGLKLSFGQSDFRLIDKKILKIILDMPEYHKFLRGQVSWIGFKQAGLSYDVKKRHAGKPKYSYKSLYELAMNGIFSFGKYPLHIVMLLGVAIFVISSIYIILVLSLWLLEALGIFHASLGPGWPTLVVSIFFLGSIQLIAIGILSEYVGRIYDQTKSRPIFIVKEKNAE